METLAGVEALKLSGLAFIYRVCPGLKG